MDEPRLMSEAAEKCLDGLTEAEKKIARETLTRVAKILPDPMTEAVMAGANMDRLADAIGSCLAGGIKFMARDMEAALKRIRNQNNN